ALLIFFCRGEDGQGEDGVTGVQTGALPISPGAIAARPRAGPRTRRYRAWGTPATAARTGGGGAYSGNCAASSRTSAFTRAMVARPEARTVRKGAARPDAAALGSNTTRDGRE